MFCGPRPGCVLPAVVHPTKCCVNNTFSNNIVPHIHPSHTTNVHHTNFDHIHYTPHTESQINEVTHQHFYGGPVPPAGVGVPRPGYGPGPGFGAGPGYGF
ncbi:CotD family spore coat protein [Bacillus sp. FJAT-27251]|uniref:CotD family spore coat protein n=1 Tax=Bacillus sp. FJAT-27251 TaxID=1684142 RepID=UPI0009E273F5|nr:CotD family spore coat protein [Bacillus sp. FJAT-27251]